LTDPAAGFRELPPTLALEAEVLAFWSDERIYARAVAKAAGRPDFTFYEGPPTANGTPHNGHVLTRVMKDMVLRYRSMRGFRVARKAGWDTHGLPVEVEVEKQLGILGKQAIEAYGIDAFARKCRDSVFAYTREWEDHTRRIGFWVDLDEAYVTYRRAYVESVWWALSELHRKGLLYQGHKVIWWWPQGGTALSAAEVGLGYKSVEDPAVTVRFPLVADPATSLLAWTTTPWTLPSNTAIAVNRSLDYEVREKDGRRVIAAVGCRIALDEAGEVVRVVKGADLIGQRYTPPYDFATPVGGDAFRVVHADFVTADAGTGIAHEAPAFGADDYELSKAEGIGMLQLVGPDGNFVAGTGFLEGRFCKDADREIIRDLRARGLLFRADQYRHDYPFCWRSDSDPLIQYARPAWFIRTTARNAEVLANNDAVHWLPSHVKDGRFGDFLRNNVDWALSRERFWGTPLNIWRCERCDHTEAPASSAEILARNPDAFDPSVDADLQVHRPWIDRVTFGCPKCDGVMQRVPEVIDVWFDSGCMPFAQWGFPHAGREEFLRHYPADFITEAVDQTRGWFYSLHMVGTLLFDQDTTSRLGLPDYPFPRPFRTCVVLGHVGDASGQKESKSKGNYTPPDLVMRGRMTMRVEIDPAIASGTAGFKAAQVRGLGLTADEKLTAVGPTGVRLAVSMVEADVKPRETVLLNPDDAAALGLDGTVDFVPPFDALGADSFRWLFSVSTPWANTRLSIAALREGQREFLMRLRNVYEYFRIYANLNGFRAEGIAPPVAGRDPLDRWILHEAGDLAQRMTQSLDAYLTHEAARAAQDFVEGLSNWFVRRSRRRFWGDGPATQDALWTLHEALHLLVRAIAPFVPFQAEAMWRGLTAFDPTAAPSVHMAAFPTGEGVPRDPSLAAAMATIRELASLGLQARNQVGVKIRQPLERLEIVLADRAGEADLAPLLPLLRDEVNVREVRFGADAEAIVAFRVKPNFRLLGKRLGGDMKACQQALATLPAAEARRQALAGGIRLSLPSGEVVLTAEEVLVEVVPKAASGAAGSAAAVVALDPTVTADLAEEGLAREIVSRIQTLRRECELGYADRVALAIGGAPEVEAAARRFQPYIAEETLAVRYLVGAVDGGSAGDVDRSLANGHELLLTISKAGTGPGAGPLATG
jgi:isoleucyl-tRNA synthetase